VLGGLVVLLSLAALRSSASAERAGPTANEPGDVASGAEAPEA
jgi:hypothetical protein